MCVTIEIEYTIDIVSILTFKCNLMNKESREWLENFLFSLYVS